MEPKADQQTPNEPERGPEETQLESEDLETIAGGRAVPMYNPIVTE